MQIQNLFQFFLIKRLEHKKLEYLNKLQEKKMKRIINYAYNNTPYYHKKFKEHKIRPQDIKTINDLKKLPLLTKDDVLANYNDFLRRDIPTFETHQTSGTSGKPLCMQYEQQHVFYNQSLFLRQLFMIGYKPWWKILYFDKIEKQSSHAAMLNFFKLFRKEILDISLKTGDIQAKILKFQPTLLITSPSMIINFYPFCEELKTKIFVLGGEVITKKMMKIFKQKFSLDDIFEWYSCWEFGYMGAECKEHSGMHLNLDANIFEFLENNEDVSPGELGDITITNLTNFKMPLLRYKIGDLGVPLDLECSCGRSLPLVKNIKGRNDDLIVLPSGKLVLPEEIINLFLNVYEFDRIKQLRIIQQKKSKIIIEFVGDQEEKELIFPKLLKALLNENVEISMKKVDIIPTKKIKFISSEVNNPFKKLSNK